MILRFSLFSSFIFACTAFAYVRSVYPKRDEILPIRTAIGIATIIQVPDAIESAIIGDASAYKVEYLNNAVTIKPLRYGARTNLYLVTKSERYNLQLEAVAQSSADYVVYVKDGVRTKPIRWAEVHLIFRKYFTNLTVMRIGHTNGGFLLINGSYSSRSAAPELSDENPNDTGAKTRLNSKYFWIYQGKSPIEIDTLYLSNPSLSRKDAVDWSASINLSAVNRHKPLTIEIKGVHTARVAIPARYLW